jgi:hypothetical protein
MCMDCGARSRDSSGDKKLDALWDAGCIHSLIRVYSVPTDTGIYIPVTRNVMGNLEDLDEQFK